MKSYSQRTEYIRQRNDAAKKDQNRPAYPIKNWRGKREPMYLKIIEIDTDYLMFRLENSRTEIQQLKYLRENPSLPKNLFSDPESMTAQAAQETILTQINRAAGKDFYEDLKTRGQDEPAIITFDGYLINGNRRTAALKNLGASYINCVVLPEDTTPKDIYALEQELQISQDFREPYHWINELRNIRKGIEDIRYGYKEGEIAKRLRIDIKELKAKRRMLELIDSFLEWRGIVGEYDYPKLEDTEQIFIQLEKAIKKYSKEPHKLKELKNAVFTLIEEKPSKGRLYGYVMDLIKNFDQVYVKVQATTQSETKNETNSKIEKSESILDSILEGEQFEFTTIFSDPCNATTLASTLVEKIADVKAENKEKLDNEAVYEAVSSALRELQGLVIDNDTTKLDSIKSKLEQIINTSQTLLGQLQAQEE